MSAFAKTELEEIELEETGPQPTHHCQSRWYCHMEGATQSRGTTRSLLSPVCPAHPGHPNEGNGLDCKYCTAIYIHVHVYEICLHLLIFGYTFQVDVNDVDKQREETILPSLLQSIHSYTVHCLSINCCAFVESSPLHTLKSVDKEDSSIQLVIPF